MYLKPLILACVLAIRITPACASVHIAENDDRPHILQCVVFANKVEEICIFIKLKYDPPLVQKCYRQPYSISILEETTEYGKIYLSNKNIMKFKPLICSLSQNTPKSNIVLLTETTLKLLEDIVYSSTKRNWKLQLGDTIGIVLRFKGKSHDDLFKEDTHDDRWGNLPPLLLFPTTTEFIKSHE